MRKFWQTLLLTTIPVLFLGAPSALADQDPDKLEDWQRQILRALEAAEAQDPGEGDPRSSYRSSPSEDSGAAEAAEKARQRYGGKPLAAVRVGDRYRVRLLLDDGRVVTVDVNE